MNGGLAVWVERWRDGGRDEAAAGDRGGRGRTRPSQNVLVPWPRQALVSPLDKKGVRRAAPSQSRTHPLGPQVLSQSGGAGSGPSSWAWALSAPRGRGWISRAPKSSWVTFRSHSRRLTPLSPPRAPGGARPDCISQEPRRRGEARRPAPHGAVLTPFPRQLCGRRALKITPLGILPTPSRWDCGPASGVPEP